MESFDQVVAAARARAEQERTANAAAAQEASRQLAQSTEATQLTMSLARGVAAEAVAVAAGLQAHSRRSATAPQTGVLRDTYHDLRRRSKPVLDLGGSMSGVRNQRIDAYQAKRADIKLARLLQPYLLPVWQTETSFRVLGTDDWHEDHTYWYLIGENGNVYTSTEPSSDPVLLNPKPTEQLSLEQLGSLRQGLGNLVVKHSIDI